MPYIKEARRKDVIMNGAMDAGELNYLITYWLNQYILDNDEKYQVYNDIMGALEGAKFEMYRRRVALYEEKKVKENGDVY